MMGAMNEISMEPVIIDDLVAFGEDIGFERGIKTGRLEGIREALLTTFEARGIELGEPERARILEEPSMARLRAWLRRAFTAGSASELFSHKRSSATPRARAR
jgi:hypothetical protein